jgi:hypothetical protein
MVLTKDELFELTGYKRKKEQARWLREHRFAFEVDCHGNPKVLRETVYSRHKVAQPEPQLQFHE